jgi:hypothetical protein
MTAAVTAYLSQDPSTWTLEGLTALATSKQELPNGRGVYLLICGRWVYVGSPRHLKKRIEEHMVKITAALADDASVVSPFYKIAAEAGEPPLVVHISNDPFVWEPNAFDSDDDDGQFLELAESVMTSILKSLPAIGKRQGQRDDAMRAGHPAIHAVTFDWNGGNSCYPASSADGEASYRTLMLKEVLRCHHEECGLLFSPDFLDDHLRAAYDDSRGL